MLGAGAGRPLYFFPIFDFHWVALGVVSTLLGCAVCLGSVVKVGVMKTYQVTVRMLREYSATIAIRARSQAEADGAALAAFAKWASEEGCQALPLGFPPPWEEHENIDREPEVDTAFRCVDCEKDTCESGQYYSVVDDVWAASGLAPNGGMLCLACLEGRIGRPLTKEDFTALYPAAWERHVTARAGDPEVSPEQLEMWR
jgi:hypothetical protein